MPRRSAFRTARRTGPAIRLRFAIRAEELEVANRAASARRAAAISKLVRHGHRRTATRPWPGRRCGLWPCRQRLTEADWTANTFRQDALASSVHSATDNILMKTEWHPSATSSGIGHFEDLVHVWAKERGLDPKKYLPIAREDTDVWPVYTMPEWTAIRECHSADCRSGVELPQPARRCDHATGPGTPKGWCKYCASHRQSRDGGQGTSYSRFAKQHAIRDLQDRRAEIHDAHGSSLRLQQSASPFRSQYGPAGSGQSLHRLLCKSWTWSSAIHSTFLPRCMKSRRPLSIERLRGDLGRVSRVPVGRRRQSDRRQFLRRCSVATRISGGGMIYDRYLGARMSSQ